MGGVTDSLKALAHTPLFFNNPLRKYNKRGIPIFENENQRLYNEFYQLLRTIQQVSLPYDSYCQ